MKKSHWRESTNRQCGVTQMEFGQWSEILIVDRQDFVHKLEFEVSKGKIGRSYINLMTFSPRQAVWVTDYRTWHRRLISHREDDQGRTCAMSYCLLCWDSKYDCTTLQCACKCPSDNTDQIMVEYFDRLMQVIFRQGESCFEFVVLVQSLCHHGFSKEQVRKWEEGKWVLGLCKNITHMKTMQTYYSCVEDNSCTTELHNSESNCFIRKHLQSSLSIIMWSK